MFAVVNVSYLPLAGDNKFLCSFKYPTINLDRPVFSVGKRVKQWNVKNLSNKGQYVCGRNKRTHIFDNSL